MHKGVLALAVLSCIAATVLATPTDWRAQSNSHTNKGAWGDANGGSNGNKNTQGNRCPKLFLFCELSANENFGILQKRRI